MSRQLQEEHLLERLEVCGWTEFAQFDAAGDEGGSAGKQRAQPDRCWNLSGKLQGHRFEHRLPAQQGSKEGGVQTNAGAPGGPKGNRQTSPLQTAPQNEVPTAGLAIVANCAQLAVCSDGRTDPRIERDNPNVWGKYCQLLQTLAEFLS